MTQHQTSSHVVRNNEQKEKKWRVSPSSAVLVIGLAVIVGYLGGMRHDQILAAVAPAVGIRIETGSLDLASVQQTFRELKSNFDGKLDDQALIQGASKGLVAAAGDVHTEYFTKQEAKQFNESLTGNIGGGVGAEIGMRDGNPTVIRTLPDTPAAKGGLLAGDRLGAVNDQPLDKLTVDQVVQKIRGEIGTTVKMTVVRDGEVKNITLTREEIVSPSVTGVIDGDTGTLRISRFDEQTGLQARTEATKFKDAGVKKVVLDLRDNGGGYLSAAPEVAGLWLNDKVVATEKRDGKVLDQQKTGRDAILEGVPTIVIVNGGTASAAEIVTAALKVQAGVGVVGETTYGKGTVQTMRNLSGGTLLKVTVQRWYTPDDKNIDGQGLKPDKVVGLTNADAAARRDPQLEAAKALLNE